MSSATELVLPYRSKAGYYETNENLLLYKPDICLGGEPETRQSQSALIRPISTNIHLPSALHAQPPILHRLDIKRSDAGPCSSRWTILPAAFVGTPTAQVCAAPEGGSNVGGCGGAGIESGGASGKSKSAGSPNESRKRKDDNKQPREGKRRSRPTRDDEEHNVQKWACPFFLHEPDQYDCRGLRRIGDVRQHLYRCHKQTAHCPRCGITPGELRSSGHGGMDAHIVEQACQLGEVTHTGVTPDQWAEICRQGQSRASMTPMARWYIIWRIIFPEHQLPMSPYLPISNRVTYSQILIKRFINDGHALRTVNNLWPEYPPGLQQIFHEHFRRITLDFIEWIDSQDKSESTHLHPHPTTSIHTASSSNLYNPSPGSYNGTPWSSSYSMMQNPPQLGPWDIFALNPQDPNLLQPQLSMNQMTLYQMGQAPIAPPIQQMPYFTHQPNLSDIYPSVPVDDALIMPQDPENKGPEQS